MKELVNKYLLYVGNFYPHKNIKRLVSAFERMIRETGLDYYLILVGGGGPSEAGRIIMTGYVDDNRLNNLYRGADLYVFPSLREGFGLPGLEAMKRGLAVVCSDNSCLPEIFGDAALYFNPLNIEEMAEKIKKALLDKGLRSELMQRGLRQFKKYDWRRTAEQTLALYESI